MNREGRDFSFAWWIIFIMIVSVVAVPILWSPMYKDENQYALSCLGEITVIIIPTLIGIAKIGKKRELNRLGFRGFPLRLLPFLIFITITAQPFLNLLTSPVVLFTRLLFDVEKTVNMVPVNGREWAFAVLSVMIIAPLVEELVFRGILMNLFERYGALVSLVMTSLAFSMMHFAPESAVLMFFMGFLLGVIRLSTGSLWAAIIAHSANNIMAFLPSVIPGLYDKITTPILFAEIVLFPLMLFFFMKLVPEKRVKEIKICPEKKANFSVGKLLSILIYAGYAGIIMAVKLVKTITYYM